MKLTLDNIEIRNFKSIEESILRIKKYGSSYLTILIGLNEAGKTNILEAIKFFSENMLKSGLNYKAICCKTAGNLEYSEIYYRYSLPDNFKTDFSKHFDATGDFLEKINDIHFYKNIYLHKDDFSLDEKECFYFDKLNIKDFAYMKMPENSLKKYMIVSASELGKEGFEEYKSLDEETFTDLIKETLFPKEDITLYDVSLWAPADKYLITQQIDLNQFATNPSVCIPLQNIFALCGYRTKEEIATLLTGIDRSELLKLKTKLSKEVTNYVNNVWKEHNIDISIEIDFSSKLLSFYVKDKDDEDDFYEIEQRSQGLKQFLSLILTLSIRNKTEQCKNQIILIDEPETHLHPSGIRYMRDEILKIGENNFVFVATHSPFFIDKQNMERHVIVKKEKGITSLLPFSAASKSYDDEVLRQAFGINVLTDFLTPNKILVEGLSDCMLIQKALRILNPDFCCGMTNGQGGNIKQVASVLKYYDVPCLVIVDDDKDGREYRDKIKGLGYPFSSENVLTIHDICGEIPQNSTIEDCLDKEFIKGIVNTIVRKCDTSFSFNPDEQKQIVTSLKDQIIKCGLKAKANGLIEEIKTEISEKFNPNAKSLEEKNPLLKKLAESIIEHLKKEMT